MRPRQFYKGCDHATMQSQGIAAAAAIPLTVEPKATRQWAQEMRKKATTEGDKADYWKGFVHCLGLNVIDQ